ncbi:sugar phosphate isomerase/epimerase family protein [Pseudokineococcus sp. 1T1Z-3]|uniref:sugar phosphate isomerase/epimerase family protein n=1 Tax=Pseudokineococcus sp. 1T1Z-3 TaxID=3132745 RepID=UPI00309FE5C3
MDPRRVYCSTISFRHQPLAEALGTITGLGFTGVDLGALPGVCDHVPVDLDESSATAVRTAVQRAGVQVRSVNADVGDLDVPDADQGAARRREQRLERLLDLAREVGATALVLPSGRLGHEPVREDAADRALVVERLVDAAQRAGRRGLELWTEAPHAHRTVCDLDRAGRLLDALPAEVGAVLDVSHVVASGGDPLDFVARHGDRTRHVHLRDAVRGDIHRSLGRGDVDFAAVLGALDAAGYEGVLALELETRDVRDEDRPEAALAAGELISGLLSAAARPAEEPVR